MKNAGRRARRDPSPELRLGAYLRVSTEEQVMGGVSLDAQRERILAHGKAHGYRLVEIEADEGLSGKLPPHRRPALRRLLDRIRAGELDGVVFLKLDRLSRSVRDILKLADEASKEGWHLISVSEHIDTSTAAGRFTLGVLALLAQMEREQTSERTVIGMEQVAREGRGRSRILPFGWRVEGAADSTQLRAGDDRSLVEHDGEMELLRRMRELRADGCGAYRIATTLNGDGKPNPRTMRPWSASTISAILRNADRRDAIRGGGAAR